jgi:hypothetical protein
MRIKETKRARCLRGTADRIAIIRRKFWPAWRGTNEAAAGAPGAGRALKRFGFDGAIDSDGVQVIVFAVPIDHHFGHAFVYGSDDDHPIRAAMSQHLGAFDLFNCASYRSFGTELGNFSLSHHDWHRKRCHQSPPA